MVTIIALSILLTIHLLPVGIGVYLVPSTSMEPSIKPLDLVVVTGGKPRVGDIVVYCLSGLSCIVHRVIKIGNGFIVTKGDNNPVPDKPVPMNSIRGIVRFIIPSYIWLSIVTFIILLDIYRDSKVNPETLPSTIIVVGVLFFLLMMLPIIFYPRFITFHTPRIYLGTVWTDGCTAVIKYTGDLSITSITDYGPRSLIDLVKHYNNTIVIKIRKPSIFLNKSSIDIFINADLSMNTSLESRIKITYVPKRLIIRYGREGLSIVNKNCFPVPVSIKYIGHGWTIVVNTSIRRGTSIVYYPTGTIYVEVRYFMHGWVSERVRVE